MPIALAAALAACSDDGGDGAEGSPDGDDWLTGSTYRAINVEGADGADVPALADLEVRFGPDGVLVATVGCNAFGGTYTLDEDEGVELTGWIEVTDVTLTQIDCSEVEQEEAWLLGVLTDETTGPFQVSDAGFHLEHGDALVELMDVAAIDAQPPLVGTTWEVRAFWETDVEVTVEVDEPGRLLLRDDGTYEAFDGCTAFEGTYELVGGQEPGPAAGIQEITLSPPPEPADGPPACREHQERMRAIFVDGDSPYIARGQSLNVFAADGGVLFTAAG